MSDEEKPFDPLETPPPPETPEGQSAEAYFEDENEAPHAHREKEPVDKETLDRLLANIRNTAKGNGFPINKIFLGDFDGEILNFDAVQILEIITEASERQVNGKERGEKAGSRQDMKSKIRSHIDRISKDREVRMQAITLLRKQDDLGYFRNGIILNLDKFGKQYVVHEPCNICETRGQVKCQTCHGKRDIMCHQCHGSREMQCTQCHGRQFMETARGRTQCNMCHGKGRIGCRTCQQTGRVKCHICRGIGTAACKQCGSTGWHSHVALLRVKAKGRFEYDHTDLPEETVELLEQYGPLLVTEEHAFVRIEDEARILEERNRKAKENEIAIPYEVKLPWGDITVNFSKNPMKGKLFGFQGLFLNSEPYLEKIVGKGLQILEEAANTLSNVGDKIAEATKYRLIAEVYMIGGRMPPKKAFETLKHKYPSGLTDQTLKAMIIRADKSLQQLTDKPRQTGMVVGLAASAAAFGLYFFMLRATIVSNLPAPQIGIVLDIILLLSAMIGTVVTVRFYAMRTIREAFKRLAKEKEKMPVKAGKRGTWGMIGVLVLFVLMLTLATVSGIEPPSWLETLISQPPQDTPQK